MLRSVFEESACVAAAIATGQLFCDTNEKATAVTLLGHGSCKIIAVT